MTIRDRIAAILREHYLWDEATIDGRHIARCRCDGDNPSVTNSVPDGGWRDFNDWTAHLADVLVRELGLTQEHGLTDWSTATGHVCTCAIGERVVDEWHSCERGQHGDESFPVTRYVTPWTAE